MPADGPGLAQTQPWPREASAAAPRQPGGRCTPSDSQQARRHATEFAWKHAPNPRPPALRSPSRLHYPSRAIASPISRRGPRPRRVVRRSCLRPIGGASRRRARRSCFARHCERVARECRRCRVGRNREVLGDASIPNACVGTGRGARRDSPGQRTTALLAPAPPSSLSSWRRSAPGAATSVLVRARSLCPDPNAQRDLRMCEEQGRRGPGAGSPFVPWSPASLIEAVGWEGRR